MLFVTMAGRAPYMGYAQHFSGRLNGLTLDPSNNDVPCAGAKNQHAID